MAKALINTGIAAPSRMTNKSAPAAPAVAPRPMGKKTAQPMPINAPRSKQRMV